MKSLKCLRKQNNNWLHVRYEMVKLKVAVLRIHLTSIKQVSNPQY